MDTLWLGRLARESLGNFEATSEIDRDLSRRALLARRDSDERWKLFGLLAWKINRFVRRFHDWTLDPWELDDVVQQSYIVFLDTLDGWSPRYTGGSPAGYLYYFLAVFPHWLANAVHRWLRNRADTVTIRPDDDGGWVYDDVSHLMVDEFCATLLPQDAALLRLHLDAECSVIHAASAIGIARRTAYRRWHHITELGREYLREAG